jgi:hypothetical protein
MCGYSKNEREHGTKKTWSRKEKNMDEELKKIIDDAETSSEDKITAIKNFVGNSYVPREKYNSLKENNTTSYNALKQEYDAFKQSKMTDEEKAEAEKAEYANKLAEQSEKIAKLSAENVFKGAGLKEEDYQDFMGNISKMDVDGAVSFAKSLTTLITNQKKVTADNVAKTIMEGTPTPKIDTAASPNELETLKSNLVKARESGDQLEVARTLEALNNYQSKQK